MSPHTRDAAHSSSTSVADSHNQKFASIAHDIAASAQASRAQTRGLEHAYTEGWYFAPNTSFQTTLLKTEKPSDTYYNFAITRPVHVDLLQRHWSGSAKPTHCHQRLQCRACHQRSQRTSRGTDSADLITKSDRDNDSDDFVVRLDAAQHHVGADNVAKTADSE